MPPTFSVIIPTYERPAELTACLDSLSRLDYPRDLFEVIVVNDGGRPLDAAVAPFLAQLDVTLVAQSNSGPAAARNAGVARARGRFIALTDDDCRPDPTWLTELERPLAANPNVLVGGKTVNTIDDNSCSIASQLLVTYLYTYYNAGRALFFTSNNMAMSREAFLSAGGFDARYRHAGAEDRELCDRWTHSGGKMIYAETALIRHSHRLTPGAFWRQHFRYGQGALHYRRARAHRDAGPVRIEPLHFYTRLLRYPWVAGQRRPARIAALLLLAQTANATGFFHEKFFGSSPA